MRLILIKYSSFFPVINHADDNLVGGARHIDIGETVATGSHPVIKFPLHLARCTDEKLDFVGIVCHNCYRLILLLWLFVLLVKVSYDSSCINFPCRENLTQFGVLEPTQLEFEFFDSFIHSRDTALVGDIVDLSTFQLGFQFLFLRFLFHLKT